jgi:hypothetical protein
MPSAAGTASASPESAAKHSASCALDRFPPATVPASSATAQHERQFDLLRQVDAGHESGVRYRVPIAARRFMTRLTHGLNLPLGTPALLSQVASPRGRRGLRRERPNWVATIYREVPTTDQLAEVKDSALRRCRWSCRCVHVVQLAVSQLHRPRGAANCDLPGAAIADAQFSCGSPGAVQASCIPLGLVSTSESSCEAT